MVASSTSTVPPFFFEAAQPANVTPRKSTIKIVQNLRIVNLLCSERKSEVQLSRAPSLNL
jgi:hypothetical protein